MAITITLRLGAHADPSDPTLVVDAPRVVIGRGASCEVWLPDPSISVRHASLRQQGAKTVIVDEGSKNGVIVNGERLPPQTPHVLRDGDDVRIGRVWLSIKLVAGVVSSLRQVHAAAARLVVESLKRDGEPCHPQLVVDDGPDKGVRFTLAEFDRDYVVGRSEEADFVLADAGVARLHVAVERIGADVTVRDMGSKAPAMMLGVELPREAIAWQDADALAIGSNLIRLDDPVSRALVQLVDLPDAKMAHAEYEQSAPRPVVAETPPEVPVAHDHQAGVGSLEADDSWSEPPEPEQDAEARRRIVDIIVVLLGLGLLFLSAAGLRFLLG